MKHHGTQTQHFRCGIVTKKEKKGFGIGPKNQCRFRRKS